MLKIPTQIQKQTVENIYSTQTEQDVEITVPIETKNRRLKLPTQTGTVL
jgi:hypothetical protein